jgi:gluconate kinase
MNVRELLQIEIWSKRTTRKILVGLVTVIGLIVVGFWVWNKVELHWLTSSERKAARAALADVDSMEDAAPLTDQEWEARKQRVKVEVEATAAAARTYRDTFMEMDLSTYFLKVEMDHVNLQRRMAGKKELHIFGSSTSEIRLKLHKELD